jgi:hypothetical protein
MVGFSINFFWTEDFMYALLIKLIFISALFEIGWSIADVERCHSRQCLAEFKKKSRAFLNIDWKPISVFPEEARAHTPNQNRYLN